MERGEGEESMRKGSRWGEVRGWIGVDASKTHVYLNEDGSRDSHKIETRAHDVLCN